MAAPGVATAVSASVLPLVALAASKTLRVANLAAADLRPLRRELMSR